jgi:hypothetical protein
VEVGAAEVLLVVLVVASQALPALLSLLGVGVLLLLVLGVGVGWWL